jgi:PAS domain-containing protein
MALVKKRKEMKNHKQGSGEFDLAGEALKKSEQQTRALIEAIPDMIFRLDEEGIFRDYKADKNDLYVQPEMFLGRNSDEVMPGWFAKLLNEKLNLYWLQMRWSF